MLDFKAFRKANKLTQKGVAAYLGVTDAFICQVEKGVRPLPQPLLSELLNNNRGWDVSNLSVESCDLSTPEQPTEDVVVISAQVLEEMSAQRQLTEQALALVQEQLEAKQETIEAVREQLATTQEQLTTSQEQLTAEQRHLSVEQQQTNAALEEARMTREAMDRRLAESNQHITELIMMLKKNETRIEREIERQQQQLRDSQFSKEQAKNAQPQQSKKSQDA